MTSIADDFSECERVLGRSGSTFALPIRLLPRPKRLATAALYAFCRLADDAADATVGHGPPAAGAGNDPQAALSRMRQELDDALAGGGSVPVIRAVTDAARRYGIPKTCLCDVLDGVEMDLVPRGFEAFADLEEYCRRVASAVGIAAIHIWGFRSDEALRPAHACGVAFQLTNILRDVREDADAGRVYLPERDLAECGADRSAVLAGRPHRGVETAMRRLLLRAGGFYAEAASLDPLLSTDGRIVFRGMFGAYAAIHRRLARRIDSLAVVRERTWKPAIAAAAVRSILFGPESGMRFGRVVS